MTRASLALSIGLCMSLALPMSARAEERRTQASVAVLAGYGHEFVQGISGQAVGFGARAGITLPFHMYLGGTLKFYLGSEEEGRSPTLSYENRRQENTLSIDVGYDFTLWDRILLRPYLATGLGLGSDYTALGTRSLSSHEIAAFIGPALTIAAKVDRFLVGVDGGVLVYPAELLPDLAAGAFMFVGMTL